LVSAGCAQNEIGRYNWWPTVVNNPLRVRNPIVKSENYWVQREVVPAEEFPGPTPEDLKRPEQDYVLGSGDLVDVTIFELLTPGQAYTTRQRISQSGRVTLPYLGSIQCAELTARGLEEKLADLLEPDYLVDPQVTVFVMEYRNLEISILNGVPRPGRYPLESQGMTLLELLAQAGGVLQLVEDYGFIIRDYTPDEADLLRLEGSPESPPEEAQEAEAAPAAPAAEGAAPAPAAPAAGEEPAPAPAATEAPPAPEAADPAAPQTEAAEARDALERMAEGEMPEVKRIEEVEAGAGAPASAPEAEAPAEPPAPQAEARAEEALATDRKELSHWVWSDGQWVEVKTEAAEGGEGVVAEAAPASTAGEAGGPAPEAPEAVAAGEAAAPAEAPAPASTAGEAGGPVDQARLRLEAKLRRLGVVQGSGQLKRIVRFDVQALQAGDPTQNLILRDGDIITIPSPPVGDFYMTGYVLRPGVYSLTGRKITLLQAVAAAGGLTAIAVPWRTEVVRRVTEGEEEIIYVDLSKVARGEVPDFYVQPEDLIRVGTDWGAIHNAVIRNAFRATYGAGFVYDMNFADFYPWTGDIQPIF
jgi:protein involved in polysaccharide export with SLBB domain